MIRTLICSAALLMPQFLFAQSWDLVALTERLPEGWELTISRNARDIVGHNRKPAFELRFTLPTKKYKTRNMSGEFEVHPTLLLTFFPKFSRADKTELERLREELRIHSERQYAIPQLLCETAQYSVFYHPQNRGDVREVEGVVRRFLAPEQTRNTYQAPCTGRRKLRP